MASYYSADGQSGPVFTQAEMCALQDAVSEAMAAGAAQASDGVGNFGNNFAEAVRETLAEVCVLGAPLVYRCCALMLN